jgi:Flp pilus assembly pilin Flp
MPGPFEESAMIAMAGTALRRLQADRRGLKAIEHAMLAAFAIVAIVGLVGPLDTLLSDIYQTMLSKVPT